MKNIVNEINVRDNILISVVIIKNKINYLNDYDEFRDILIKNSLDKYQGPKKIKGNSVCYLCDNHTEVYGLVSNAIGFAFSTPEKIGNVPGTDIKNQWKLLPICSDCALYLNAGKNFIDDYLNFSEFGLTYYIIPSFLFDYKGFDKLYHYLQLFKSEDSLKSQDLLKIENSVSRLLKNFDNYVEFKFLFYKSKNNALDILSYIESVIPSWLNKLYASQIKIEQYNLFHEDELKLIFGKNHNGNFLSLINKNEKKYPCVNDNWYKKFLKDFLADTPKNKKNIDKVYLDIVSDIISNSKVDYNFLLSKFMNEMRFQWRNERYHDLKISVLKALMLILLLNDLNIFYGGNKLNFDNEVSIELILDSSSKKASFLLGVLTRKLLNKQLRELDSTPFFNKLWGLSLDHKKIKKLYPMVINKLREYNITYLELEKEISNNLILSEKDWNLTRDETSYYFVLGYTLYKFYLNKGDDKNE